MVINQKTLILFSCASALAVASIAFVFSHNKNPVAEKNFALSHKITSHSSLENISANVLVNDSINSQKSFTNNDVIHFQSAESKAIQKYKIAYRLENKNYDVADLSINLNNQNITIFAEGFNPTDSITLKNNDIIIYDSVNMDWSGQIELRAHTGNSNNTCVVIGSEGQQSEFCHVVAEKRQVS